MKGREELFSFKIPAPSVPGAKIGRPRPSTTATPRKLPLHSTSAFTPFAHYSDRLIVLERGLNALAVKIGVSYQRTNWQEIINNIGGQLKNMPRGAQKDFYLEVNAQFGFLKDAYRNHAEHARDDHYDLAKALSIINHVRAFMQALADGGLTE